MKSREQHGGALPLVLVSTIALLSLGMAFFFLIKLIGGHRELQNAADSGALGVAHVGVEAPFIPLTQPGSGNSRSPFEGLMDASVKGINLQTYNRAVGQTFLVALNAEAEGTSEGIKNARNLIQVLQGPNGMGARLSAVLNPAGSDINWVDKAYAPGASTNSLRMLADNSSTPLLKYKTSAQTYKTAFVHPASSELNTSCTNAAFHENFNKQIPFSNYALEQHVALPENTFAQDQPHSYLSLRGYDPIKVGRVGSICAVTMSPFEQAHLVSNHDFFRCIINPGAAVGLIPPPNSFQMNSTVPDKRTNLDLHVQTSSAVGTKAINIPLASRASNTLQLSAAMPKYDIAIPRGYLIIDNMGDGKDSSYFGRLPQPNTRSAPWYSTTGVSVDEPGSGFFSNNGRLEEWMKYNYAAKNRLAVGPQPSLDGLYKSDGRQPSLSEAANLITPTLKPKPCACNDLNSDLAGKNPDLTCVKYASSIMYFPGPFDTAYFPNYLNPPQWGKSGVPLTAAELAKMKLWELYMSDGGLGGLYVHSNRTTGARVYPHAPEFKLNDPLFGQAAPYNAKPGTDFTMGENVSADALAYSNQSVPGQISRNGSILELLEQIAVHSADPRKAEELKRFLLNRMYQIKPDASADEISTLLGSKKIEVRQKYYIYLDAHRNFVLSTTRPFWIDGNDPKPDGRTRTAFTIPRDLLGTFVNTPADFDIHQLPFWDSTPSTLYGTLTASFTPSSGANNMLGLVKFTDDTTIGLMKFTNAN